MAQSYFPSTSRSASPSPVTETVLAPQERIELAASPQEVQEAYIEQKDRLLNGIDSTKAILGNFREFNKTEWVVRYPQLHPSPAPEPSSRPASLRRSLSFADDPSTTTDVVLRGGMRRSLTLASTTEEEDDSSESTASSDETLVPPASEFHVLRLDVKAGPGSQASLMSQLEKSSIANLLDERIQSSISHIDKLRLRVEDTASKVLVTGDLNAGKSTLVNALLRREIMPMDQQPCTTMFCEVHPAAENGGKEEVHVVREGATYDIADETTFTRAQISDLESIVTESDAQHILKMYVTDARTPQESLLNNGVVDITLIDAPGLNRDSLKTTALFARQEEIDVVVFVVSAENHFTLSAKEFLWNASNEKAYLFIVVNRFDQIRDKERCKRLVLEQIKQLSPRTWEDAEDLVHFVDSSSALHSSAVAGSFDHLESSLRSFVLIKRSKSKLTPASTYLSHLLSDVDLLAGSNAILAKGELEQARRDLERALPVLEKMKKGREALEDGLESNEEEGASAASGRAKKRLEAALERVGKGELGVEKGAPVSMPAYPGLMGVWDYTREVKRALLASLDYSVKLAEDEARSITSRGVKDVAKMAEEHLPEGVERSRRVFMPEAMFSPRVNSKGVAKMRRHSSGGALVPAGGVGVHSLGLGLAHRQEMLDVSFFDILDVQHQFSVHFGPKSDDKASASSSSSDEGSASALSVVSVGVGALTMVGGKAVGVRGIIEGIVRVSDLLGNESARKWAAPILGAATLGLAVYFVLELPYAIPRTVGRRIKDSLVRPADDDEAANEEGMFVRGNEIRIGRETRKVLRLASWDLRERFRAAMEERGKEVKGAENMQKRAIGAMEWFEDVGKRTGEVRRTVGLEIDL